MNSFYSIIRYVNNQWSNENIAVGLLVVSGNNVFYKISDSKLNFVKNLNASSFRLFNFSLNKFEDFINLKKVKLIKNFPLDLQLENSQFSFSFVEQLYKYNSGILQFSAPEKIFKEFDKESFEKYFNKMIDDSVSEEKDKKVKISDFKKKIRHQLYEPLKNKVDVDFKLSKGSLNNLYFDYHLENIGVNGAIIASASVDFNNERVDIIQKKVAEYEIVVERLKKFAEVKGLGSDHNFYLISDHYQGNSPSNMEIDSMLKNGLHDKFKRISSDEVGIIVKQVEEKNAGKFSDFLI